MDLDPTPAQPLTSCPHQLASQISTSADPQELEDLAHRLKVLTISAEGKELHQCLHTMSILFLKGYTQQFAEESLIHQKMIDTILRLSHETQADGNIKKILFVLSLIAELIKEVPKIKFPFTPKFVSILLSLQASELCQVADIDQVIAILAVIYDHIASQSGLIKADKLSHRLKLTLLEQYSLINEVFAVKLFNRAIYSLMKVGETLTKAQVSKYQLQQTLEKFVEPKTLEVLLSRLQGSMVSRSKRNKD